MDRYYVSKNAQANGDHEVHRDGCATPASPENRHYLGYYSNCHDAVNEAKKTYDQSNGCKNCSEACHTS